MSSRYIVNGDSFDDAESRTRAGSAEDQNDNSVPYMSNSAASYVSYSPQAPPPVASPPPPPPTEATKGLDLKSFVQEQNSPETSLPPVSFVDNSQTERRQQDPYSSYPHVYGPSIPASPVISSSLSNEEQVTLSPWNVGIVPALQQPETSNDDDTIPVSQRRVGYSHSYVAVKTMPPKPKIVPVSTTNRAQENKKVTNGTNKTPRNQPDSRGTREQYYQQYGQGGTAIHYEDEATAQPQRTSRNFRAANANLRPNVGLTNSYDYALWGLAPHELLRFLQIADLFAGLASLTIAVFSWLGKLIFLQLDKVVLLAYLAALSFILVFVEVTAIVVPEQQRLIPNNLMGRIRDQFGFLFHPRGKAFFVLLLTTMCWGIGGIFLTLTGSLYLIASLAWFYGSFAYHEDLPRLMGSIDETHRAEARRRGQLERHFSVSSWTEFMRDPFNHPAVSSWANFRAAAANAAAGLRTNTTTPDQQEERVGDADYLTNEQTSLLQNQRN